MTVIDDYLAGVSEPQRAVLLELRNVILELIPEAEECISYQIPCFKVNGKGIAGFAPYKKHNSYFPFSGQVFKAIPAEVADYVTTDGALHFAPDRPLDPALVKRLIEVRLSQAF
jgi:uncharacterized protein YdhG (YjbR/CyaY superfamily)